MLPLPMSPCQLLFLFFSRQALEADAALACDRSRTDHCSMYLPCLASYLLGSYHLPHQYIIIILCDTYLT